VSSKEMPRSLGVLHASTIRALRPRQSVWKAHKAAAARLSSRSHAYHDGSSRRSSSASRFVFAHAPARSKSRSPGFGELLQLTSGSGWVRASSMHIVACFRHSLGLVKQSPLYAGSPYFFAWASLSLAQASYIKPALKSLTEAT
jgi:hypothetical protein